MDEVGAAVSELGTLTIESIAAPIIGLWAAHQAIFYSAGFVNAMRETVILGRYQDAVISTRHANTILLDWKLCMTATVFVCVLFSGLMGAAAFFWKPNDPMLFWGLLAVASYPGFCAVLFAICSIADMKTMRAVITARDDAEHDGSLT